MTAKAENTESIMQSYDLPFPPAKVWRALTEPKLVEKWLMSTDLDPKVGKSFTFAPSRRSGGTGSSTRRSWRASRSSG